MTLHRFPVIEQFDSQDCGLACLKMIAKFYNKNYCINIDDIPDIFISKSGLSIADLEKTAKCFGFKTFLSEADFESIQSIIPLPAIFYWNNNHFIVVYKITKKHVWVADPAFGRIKYKKDIFIKHWYGELKNGVVLLLEPDIDFSKYTIHNQDNSTLRKTVRSFVKKNITQILLISLSILLSSSIEFIFPFFTQNIIDKGVFFKNLNIVYIILIAQFFLVISRILLEFYRSWIFIHVGSRISLSMITNFLDKLLMLPLKFFTSKNTGDIIQRIRDHDRIEAFLSKEIIQTTFAFFSVIVYSLILLYFNLYLLLVVLLCSTLSFLWIIFFLDKIRFIDYKNFSLQAKDQNKLFESISTIQDIKLNNLEEQTTQQWQSIQVKIYKNNIDKLKIEQKYECYRFIDYIQIIFVTLICSVSIINSNMTIGTFMSVMVIMGALNRPISQIINYILKLKLVKISNERINEIHSKKDEGDSSEIMELNKIEDIKIESLSFTYDGESEVLKNVNLIIPQNKTTAIVGLSGSGKTTLLKLILKFYQPSSGEIYIGDNNIESINNKLWRKKCGAILQDSSIFSESILYNITLEKEPNVDRFYMSLRLANIEDFVRKMPLQEKTIIGALGVDLSHGQKQRILIARTIYKNPDYLFFDEATNSLDAENERIITENINSFFKNKSVIIVAHRLSTVRNADQIVVLDNGSIIESGTHDDLISLKGKYYHLVKNQLELGL